MNKHEQSMGIDPKLKKDINEEGYDEDGGYVIVGTPEERNLARKRIESEGKAENLVAYIKLHKEIMVPSEKVWDVIKEKKGEGWLGGNGTLVYIDKDGSVARVTIDFQKIADADGSWEDYIKTVPDILKKHGLSVEFNEHAPNYPTELKRLIEKMNEIDKKNKIVQEKESFDL